MNVFIEDIDPFFKMEEKRFGEGYSIDGIGINFSEIEEKNLEFIAIKSINTALEYDNYVVECFMSDKDTADNYFNILNSSLGVSNRYILGKRRIDHSNKEILFNNGSIVKVSYHSDVCFREIR